MAFQNPLYASTFTSNPYPRDPYGYNNAGYGGYYSGYQQHFNHPYPRYSSNFSPHNPWQGANSQSTPYSNFTPQHHCQVASIPSTPYLYQPLEFARTSSESWTASVVLQGALAMSFFSNNTMACLSEKRMGETHKSEYSHQSLPIQQHPPIRTTIADCHPFDYSIDEEIQMVINNGTSIHTDKIGNHIFIADNPIEHAISETSLIREELAESEKSKEEKLLSL
ncbi:hypothetical protein H5410_041918 [Solanum commersonii]|uniref:Uncharacterized protein n=1 Tax=Solanum commersonii TaxID=4109 RepID=A0A9J5XW01_SOLCO|nr:hypothetical protein H5410_041918 [Solanum commersonii]